MKGCALNHHAKKDVKIIFAGGNVNTKALICSLFAPSIPIQNFTGLSCHLATRTSVQIAEIYKVNQSTLFLRVKLLLPKNIFTYQLSSNLL